MHRIDSNLISEELPTPKPAGTAGYFQDDNPEAGGTELTADWLNSIQEELASIVEEVGDTLDKTSNRQVLPSIRKLGRQYAVFVYETATGVNGIDITAGTFTKCPITEDVNHLPGCSITNGVITLSAGSYLITGYCVASCAGDNYFNKCMAGVFKGDSAAAADLLVHGSSGSIVADQLNEANIPSFVEGEIVLETETTLTLRMYSNTGYPMGVAVNLSGFTERFAALKIQKVG